MLWRFLKEVLVTLFFGSSFIAQSQQFISGKVINESGDYIPFASVKWMRNENGLAKYFCIGNINGVYRLNISGENSGWIEVSAIGYNTSKVFVKVENINSNYDIVLSRMIKELTPIIIINKPSVEISGDTTSYLIDNFKRGSESNIKELLSNIPGFLVSPRGSLTYNGRMIDRVLINGDDLTGRNYTGLINNLDVNGIDRLQVIQNHADNNNIISSLTGGKEQVLNIAYKKGFLNKVFGVTDVGLGVPPKYYDAGVRALALFDKAKILTLNRVNSVGNTSFEPGAVDIMPEDMNVDAAYDVQLLRHNYLAGINDIFTNADAAKAIYKNQTQTSATSILLRPSRKLSVRGRLNYAYDKYAQRMDNITDYLLGTQSFKIEENKDVRKSLQAINGLLSFNYLMNSKNQLLLTLKGASSRERSNASSLLTGTNSYIEDAKGNEKQYAAKMIYNRLFSDNTAISADLQYLAGRLPNEYHVFPPLLTDFFGFNESMSRMSQFDVQYFRHSSARITLVKRKNRHAFTFGLMAKQLKEQLRNDIGFFSTQNKAMYVGTDSVNDNKNRFSTASLTFQDAWTIDKKTTISFFTETIIFENQLKNLNRPADEQRINGIRLLPGLNTEYKFSERSRLSFSYNFGNRFCDASQVTNGFAVQSLTSIYKGMDSLQTGLSQTARLTYAYTNLLKKRLFIFSHILFVRTPLLYLMEIQPYPNFTYSRYIPADRMMNTLMVSLSGQKLSDDYKTQVSPSVNLSQGYNYRLIQGIEEKVKFRQLQAGLNFNSEIKKTQLKTRLQYRVNEQHTSKRFINQYWEASVQSNWKLTDRIFLDMLVQYNYLKPSRQRSADLWSTEAKILFKSQGNKWDFGIQGTNLFNQTAYTNAMISATNTSITSYNLFPRIATGFVKYRF